MSLSAERKPPSLLTSLNHGINYYLNTVYKQNTQDLFRLFKRALMLGYTRFMKPLHHPMVLLWICMLKLIKKLLTGNYVPNATLNCFLKLRLNNSLAPSSPLLCPWFQNQAKWPSCELFTISPTPIPLQAAFPQLTIPLILTYTLAPGAPLGQSVSPFTTFLWVFRPLSEMSQRLTASYWSFLSSGWVLLSNYKAKTHIVSTPMITLVLLQLGAFIERSLMLELTFSVLRGLALYLNG
jgi:hypothetical protein